MGYYLNSSKAFSLYKSEANKPYFVDKTDMLKGLILLAEQGNSHICITRPRRFGKSVMAAMVAAFFGKGFDSSGVFESLKIANDETYRIHLNQHHVIYINFSDAANLSENYEDFISRIERPLSKDLRRSFPDVDFWDGASPIEDLGMIHEETGEMFILVFDEWDCIFRKPYVSDDNRRSFINFLAALTKDKGYVSLSYMTGVLPIAKYSSGLTINHFDEYTMVTDDKYNRYFGFTDAEVDELYHQYEKIVNAGERTVSREDLKLWYDGYHTPSLEKVYNPRSVVFALERNRIRSYWTSTGPYSEIATYIVNDVDEIKKDVALMTAGEEVDANINVYASTFTHLRTRNEILSAMVVYGFLDYKDGKVRIPNKELMDEFADTIREQKDLGYIYRLAKESERMLQATLSGDTKTMEEILQFAHDIPEYAGERSGGAFHRTETPLLDYNHETELTAIVNLVYLAARDSYHVERENKAGKGYVDFIFYPERQGDDGIILELKVGDTPEAAIRQIRDRNYVLKFQGKMAERKRHTGRILMVGVGYSKKEKVHRCRVEVV